jgi:hypothetical protein
LITQFIDDAILPLETLGYEVNDQPQIPGVVGLLYAKVRKSSALGPVKFDTHLLFVDWERDLFARVELLDVYHQYFSDFVNLSYKTPHVWRMKIPNLAVVTLSADSFSAEAVRFVQNDYRVPWKGGETAQTILVDLKNKQLHQHGPQPFKQYGSIPLACAAEDVKRVCSDVFSAAKGNRWRIVVDKPPHKL